MNLKFKKNCFYETSLPVRLCLCLHGAKLHRDTLNDERCQKNLGDILKVAVLQNGIFEIFEEKHKFPSPLEIILRQFTAQLRKSKDERNGAKHFPPEKISKKNGGGRKSVRI